MIKVVIFSVLIVISLALIPFALAATARAVPSKKPRIHFVQDMDNQPKFRAQHANDLFEDGRAMRPPVAGTVSRGNLQEDGHYYLGVVNDAWATTFPARIRVDMDLLDRGRERFNIYCTPCHGYAGYGDGMVDKRTNQILENSDPEVVKGTSWVKPKSVHEKLIREQPIGQLYNSINNGVRTMSGYGSQIPVADRWAIVAYVKALQKSQTADLNDIPADQREDLSTIKLSNTEQK